MEQTKTHDVVRVPLGKMALSLLPERKNSSHASDLPTATAVHFSCKWIAEHAGINKNVSYHTSRHTFATLLLTYNFSIEKTARALGHKDIKTTQIYAKVLKKTIIDSTNQLVAAIR